MHDVQQLPQTAPPAQHQHSSLPVAGSTGLLTPCAHTVLQAATTKCLSANPLCPMLTGEDATWLQRTNSTHCVPCCPAGPVQAHQEGHRGAAWAHQPPHGAGLWHQNLRRALQGEWLLAMQGIFGDGEVGWKSLQGWAHSRSEKTMCGSSRPLQQPVASRAQTPKQSRPGWR